MKQSLPTVQAGTGLIFLLYLVLHLANTTLAAFSPAAYDAAQQALRKVYQFPALELCIFAAIAVHVVIGIYRSSTRNSVPTSPRMKAHRYTGLFLAFAIVAHVLAVRGPSLAEGIYPGFAGVAFTLAKSPLFFFPYYLIFATFALFHALNGAQLAVQRLGGEFRLSDRTMLRITVLGAILVAIALLGFGGVLYEIGDPFDNAYARFMEQYM